jgi:hypothetical protein
MLKLWLLEKCSRIRSRGRGKRAGVSCPKESFVSILVCQLGKNVTREGADITRRALTGGYGTALKSHIHL